nr:flagellar hook-basal body complex protein FliE [Halobacillus kuroshimensis]
MAEMIPLTSVKSISEPVQSQWQKGVSPSEAHRSFSGQLKNAVEQLNHVQVVSDEKTKALATGEIDDLHDVMIASQKAGITMQTAVEVQSKVIDAYKEMMRMQV